MLKTLRFLALAVLLALLDAPLIAQTSEAGNQITVLSAASNGPVVAPGGLATIYGQSLAGSESTGQPDVAGTLPTVLDGVSVQIDGKPAPLLYVGPTQINFLIPQDAPLGQPIVSVLKDGVAIAQGRASVVAVAPAIFFSGRNRGAVLDAISYQREPFVARGASTPDGLTRLSIFLTGLNRAQNSSNPVDVLIRSSAGTSALAVEYAGPQGQFPGLDQVNVVLPESVDAAGDVQITVITGGVVSNAVSILIKDSMGPTISAVSQYSAAPFSRIKVSGEHFAAETNRNLVTFEQAGAPVMSVFPFEADKTSLTFLVPYESAAGGSHLLGTFSLCLQVDDRKACTANPFVVSPLPVTADKAGSTVLKYLDYLEQSQTGTIPEIDPETADLLRRSFQERISELREAVVAAMAGQNASVTGIGLEGPKTVPLTRDDLAQADAFIANSGVLEHLETVAASLARQPLGSQRLKRATNASGYQPTPDEEALVFEAQRYRNAQAVYDRIDTITRNWLFKAVVCGADFFSGGGASAVINAGQIAVDSSIVSLELQRSFLNRVLIQPANVHPRPNGTAQFDVVGTFTRKYDVSGQVDSQALHDLVAQIYSSMLDVVLSQFHLEGCDKAAGTMLGYQSALAMDEVKGQLSDWVATQLLSGTPGRLLSQGLTRMLNLVTDPERNVYLTTKTVAIDNPSSLFSINVGPGPTGGRVLAGNQASEAYETARFTPAAGQSTSLEIAYKSDPFALLFVRIDPNPNVQPPKAYFSVTAGNQSSSGPDARFTTNPHQPLSVILAAGSENLQFPLVGDKTIWKDNGQQIATGLLAFVSLSPGIHQLSCYVENSQRLGDEASMTVTVVDPTPPFVEIEIDSVDGQGNVVEPIRGGTSQLSVTARSDGTGVAFFKAVSAASFTSYSWKANGQEFSRNASATQTFPSGKYNIELSVVDVNGITGRASGTLTVVPSDRLDPAFSFYGAGISGQNGPSRQFEIPDAQPVAVTFDASRTVSSRGINAYAWSLNGGSEQSGKIVVLNLGIGANSVRLTVTDAAGATKTASVSVTLTTKAPTNPMLVVDQPSISVSFKRGDATPLVQPVNVRNAGGGVIKGTAQVNQLGAGGWLKVDGGIQAKFQAPQVLRIELSAASLDIGTYTGALVVMPDDPSVPSVSVPITVSVVAQSGGVLTINPVSLPDAVVGQSYFAQLSAQGGAVVRWTVLSGSLPAGLTIDGRSGVITGTLARDATTSSFSIQGEDGTGRTASQQFTIRVAASLAPSVSGINPSSPTATVGNQNVGVTGSNFQSGLTVDVYYNGSWIANLSGSQVLNVTANSFTMVINFNGNAGSYGIEVINPGNKRSARYNFTVQAQQLTPSVSGISPSSPTATVGNQNVGVTGSNFQSGLTVDVFNGSGTWIANLSGTQILSQTANSFTMVINFNGNAGSYGIEVINPGNKRSARYTFTVQASTPQISYISPSTPSKTAGNQNVWVYGSGFQQGLTVTVFFPGGGSGLLSGTQIQNVSATSFMMVINFNNNSGPYSIRVNNPSGPASATFPFNVN